MTTLFAASKQPDRSLHDGATANVSLRANQLDRALHILRMKQLVERTRLSRATLYALIANDPTFPRKIQLTARTVGWLESEVDAWIASRACSRASA